MRAIVPPESTHTTTPLDGSTLEAERAFDDPLHEHAGNGDHLMAGPPIT
jgi:hypothetical protein